MFLEHCDCFFLGGGGQFVAGGLELRKKEGLSCSKNIMLPVIVCWSVLICSLSSENIRNIRRIEANQFA